MNTPQLYLLMAAVSIAPHLQRGDAIIATIILLALTVLCLLIEVWVSK